MAAGLCLCLTPGTFVFARRLISYLKSSSPEPLTDFHETWYIASRTPANYSLICSNYDPLFTLTFFAEVSYFVSGIFYRMDFFSQKLLHPVT